MAHAFDPQSVNHDHLGIRKKTLTLADTKQYKLLQDSLSRIYNKLLIKENHYTNGQKVLIETISDHLGLAVAFNAFKLAQTNIAETEIDGYSGFEMFFISYAQKYREHLSEECIQRYILDYYHPLPRYRVNIPVYSIPEFFEIFCLDQSQKKEAYFSVW